jgi:hypothetical protein
MLIKSNKIFLGAKPHHFIVSIAETFLWKENAGHLLEGTETKEKSRRLVNIGCM